MAKICKSIKWICGQPWRQVFDKFISPYNPNNIKPLRLQDKYGFSNTRRPNLRNSKEIFLRDYYDIDNFTYYLWFSFFKNFENLK